nr:MAG TPA: hypothetical protein [Caudoviricetes sp.]
MQGLLFFTLGFSFFFAWCLCFSYEALALLTF